MEQTIAAQFWLQCSHYMCVCARVRACICQLVLIFNKYLFKLPVGMFSNYNLEYNFGNNQLFTFACSKQVSKTEVDTSVARIQVSKFFCLCRLITHNFWVENKVKIEYISANKKASRLKRKLISVSQLRPLNEAEHVISERKHFNYKTRLTSKKIFYLFPSSS